MLAASAQPTRLVAGLGNAIIVAEANGRSERLIPEDTVSPSSGLPERILAIDTSDDGQWIVAATSVKAIHCYALNSQWQLVSTAFAQRRPSALALATHPDGPSVAVAFACGGDLYVLPIPNLNSCAPVFCLGHTSSVITHIAFPRVSCRSAHPRVVITCDRNEKIRVSAWPQTSVINAFCLGHTAFVSRAAFIGDSCQLVSCGGDGMLRLWDTNTGFEIQKVQVGTEMTCTCLAVSGSAIAVGTAKESVARVYNHSLELASTIALPTPPIDLIYVGGASLLVLVSDPSIILCEFRLETAPATYASSSSLSTISSALVETARRCGMVPPASALHALESLGNSAGDDDVEHEHESENGCESAPSVLRKHALHRKLDLTTLGKPRKGV